MYDPTEFPYVRAQTYVDDNPPAVLSDEFYNPVQDALARMFGGMAGYSTSVSNEEFVLSKTGSAPAAGDRFGQELTVLTNPGSNFLTATVTPTGPNEHGIVQVYGAGGGDRGGSPGFRTGEAPRFVDTLRWIMRWRVRCSNFTTLESAPPGLQLASGDLTTFNYPAWLADGTTGFWITVGQAGPYTTAVPTVDGEWIDLWVAVKDADAECRWYYKRDADPLPVLVRQETLTSPSLQEMQRWMRYQVTGGAAAVDNIELDCVGFNAER